MSVVRSICACGLTASDLLASLQPSRDVAESPILTS